MYIAPGSRFDRKANSRTGKDAYNHLLLLAENEIGYQNLVRLTTAAHLEGFYYKPRIDKELLEAHHEGIIAFAAVSLARFPSDHTDDLDKARAARLVQAASARNDFFSNYKTMASTNRPKSMPN